MQICESTESSRSEKMNSDSRPTTARTCNTKSGEILCKSHSLGWSYGKRLMVTQIISGGFLKAIQPI